jgi:hypothetical protein
MRVLDVNQLRKEIESTFPFAEMPPQSQILAHGSECNECSHLLDDVADLRGTAIDGNAIRLLHQEMSHISAAGWRWILPHYLRYCLTPEAWYNRFETEFLIYNLGPDLKFQLDTEKRLSLLSSSQLVCLEHFLEWCLEDDYWKVTYTNHVNRAISFLRVLIAARPGQLANDASS